MRSSKRMLVWSAIAVIFAFGTLAGATANREGKPVHPSVRRADRITEAERGQAKKKYGNLFIAGAVLCVFIYLVTEQIKTISPQTRRGILSFSFRAAILLGAVGLSLRGFHAMQDRNWLPEHQRLGELTLRGFVGGAIGFVVGDWIPMPEEEEFRWLRRAVKFVLTLGGIVAGIVFVWWG